MMPAPPLHTLPFNYWTDVKTEVIHWRDRASYSSERIVYIGRAMRFQGLKASPWANPFKIKDGVSREEVMERYRAYLHERPDLLARVPELSGKVLACWCKPDLLCHGDILADLANAFER
jgi:hypothetical protein